MAKGDRVCTVCGSKYKFCPYCGQYAGQPMWKMAYCSEPCRETYMAINKYAYKHITAEEAAAELAVYNVKIANKELAKFEKDIKKAIKPPKEDVETQL